MKKMMINIFTDGSCYHKTKQGGLGVYLTDGSSETFISEGYSPTTISRMEGFALLKGLKLIKDEDKSQVNIYSDSEYVIKTFTDGRHIRWQLMNWIDVKNSDMWRAILMEFSKKTAKIIFNHVRGHQKNIQDDIVFGNNVADLLSNYKNFKTFKNDKELCNLK